LVEVFKATEALFGPVNLYGSIFSFVLFCSRFICFVLFLSSLGITIDDNGTILSPPKQNQTLEFIGTFILSFSQQQIKQNKTKQNVLFF
jgi:hypothetical protein